MSKIVPRGYQIEAVESLYAYFAEKDGNPVIAVPTGMGKSLIIAMFLKSVYIQWPTQKVLVVTHVKELIRQNYDQLQRFWPFAPAGVYSAGLKQRDTKPPIIFCGVASIAKQWSTFGRVDVVVIDEAHLLSPSDKSMYQMLLKGLRSINPKLKVVGLTATPWRLGHGHIADGTLFDDVCFDITGIEAFNRAISEGFMSMLIPKNTTTKLDVTGVHIHGGEYVQSELQTAVDKNEITYAAIKEALELGYDRRHWLIFASGIEHATHISEMMESLGVSCVVVHSKMDSKLRDENIRKFRMGEVRAIANANILTTGFDSPWIDLVLVLRPTASTVLWVQMLGRATRPFLGNEVDPIVKENALVLDFAGNTRRLGPINDPVIPKKKGEGGGEAPVKLCMTCNTWNHAAVRFCICCKQEFPFETKLKQEASTAELIRGDMPKVAVFKVDHVVYSKYVKIGKPAMIKVAYFCGLRMFNEYVCVEHDGYAQRKARQWWHARTSDDPMPLSVDTALEQINILPPATHLRIWVNKKYPEILATCFDGTAFQKEAPTDDLPDITIEQPANNRKTNLATIDLDHDIPF